MEQLQMIWPENLRKAPPGVELPADYELRSFESGDEDAYLDLLRSAGFNQSGDGTALSYLRHTIPGGCFLVVHRPTGQLVATAVANHAPSMERQRVGELGWVAARPEYSGKGLGRAVCAAVTARLLELGYHWIYLKTDDHRLPALVTYLNLGYVPYLCAPDMQIRWAAVCANLAWPFTPDEWPRNRAAESDGDAGGRPDQDRMDRYPSRRLWLPKRPHRRFALMGDVDAFGDESLYRPSQVGTAVVSPARLVAGQILPLELTFTAGTSGLSDGATVTYVMRGQQPLGRLEDGYVLESPADCAAEPIVGGFGFHLREGALKVGQEVQLSVEPFEWTPLAGRREFKVVINRGDGSPEQRLPEPVVIDLMPGHMRTLEALVPCTRRRLAPVMCQVSTRDVNDNRVLQTGEATLKGGLRPRSIPITGGIGRGRVDFASESVVRVSAALSGNGLEAVSNPCVENPDVQLYVGDLHCHDFLSEAEAYT
ncbi:MAG: GNAT family N-acetyltransferase, partial [Anaerolineae bacterium]|nr:GNAT family N-acetyltransferase [Anaerolineae bacterium]